MIYSKKLILSTLFLLLVLGVAVYYAPILIKKENQDVVKNGGAAPSCLKENQMAIYEENNKAADIIILDKINNQKTAHFFIDGIIPDHYHPYEFYKCKAYIIRQFNYDSKLGRGTPNYSIELWSYNYTGEGTSTLLFSRTDDRGNYISFYNDDFRINSIENYIVLEKSYPGSDNYALVFKNLAIKENAFVLLYRDLTSEYPNLQGTFGLKEWTKDGKYFWANLFEGANVNAFLRIEKDTWKVEVLPAPKGTMGGDVLNPEFGYITYDTGILWTGIDIIAEELEKEWEQEGKKNNFYLYNLFTKEQILLETFNDPTWFTKPRWLSGFELEYQLPSGETKIYKLKD
ncbi:MAG: hypothetical protein AAB366_01315 [Patescibacteria group bacterium]